MTVDRPPSTTFSPVTWSGKRLFWTLLAVLFMAAVALDGWLLGATTAESVNWLRSLVLPILLSLLATVGVGNWAVPILRQLKTGQIIREEGPQSHQVKAGTPTMGGIFFIPTAIAMAVFLGLFAALDATGWEQLIGISVLTLAYGWLGWMDDWQVIRRKSNKGVSPRTKLLFQFGFGILAAVLSFFEQVNSALVVLLFSVILLDCSLVIIFNFPLF